MRHRQRTNAAVFSCRICLSIVRHMLGCAHQLQVPAIHFLFAPSDQQPVGITAFWCSHAYAVLAHAYLGKGILLS